MYAGWVRDGTWPQGVAADDDDGFFAGLDPGVDPASPALSGSTTGVLGDS